ncbi:alpha/beta fold hydrolase [Streptomyces sporangiiformans]|uniref:alpha/beta fold hydrolase n=1 Tax=Streptomyces sporangiiformans TaxID=2315329 RepID=UPI0015E741B6|nr:alpha/beta hydrolase [Streptomyces sporangiiformans]
MVARDVIPYEVQGSGAGRVILLHHWFGDRTAFAPMREHLNGEAFSYAFPDCRGCGEAQQMAGAFTMEEIAADVLAVADELDWDTFSVVGHSMGAIAAQLVLLNAPDRVRSLIGVAPMPASGFPLEGEYRDLFYGAVENPANRRAIIDTVTGGQEDDAWLDAMVSRSLARTTPEAFRGYLESWSTTDFHERVRGNRTPVLVVTGAHDPVLGADAARGTWLEWYPNAELDVLDGCGHFPTEETPQALAASLVQFLSRFAK